MGTSQSNAGPSKKAPLVPAWVSDSGSSGGEGVGSGGTPISDPNDSEEVDQEQEFPRRLANARLNMGAFAKTGNAEKLRQGISHYVKTSYRGAGNTVRRHGSTISTAASLFNALSPGSTSAERRNLEDSLGEGRTAEDVLNAVVEATRPVDGTQDAEASRSSIHDALSELLTRFPDVDLLTLTEEQRLFAIERYLSLDVFKRFHLDLGTTIHEKSPDARTALSRLKEVSEYIRETVSAAFRQARSENNQINTRTVNQIIRSTLEKAFQVFESYTS